MPGCGWATPPMTGRPPPLRSPTGTRTPRPRPSPAPRRPCPTRPVRATPRPAPPRPGRRRRATAAPRLGTSCSGNCRGTRFHSPLASCRRRYEPEARPALAERQAPAMTFVRGAAGHGYGRAAGGGTTRPGQLPHRGPHFAQTQALHRSPHRRTTDATRHPDGSHPKVGHEFHTSSLHTGAGWSRLTVLQRFGHEATMNELHVRCHERPAVRVPGAGREGVRGGAREGPGCGEHPGPDGSLQHPETLAGGAVCAAAGRVSFHSTVHEPVRHARGAGPPGGRNSAARPGRGCAARWRNL